MQEKYENIIQITIENNGKIIKKKSDCENNLTKLKIGLFISK